MIVTTKRVLVIVVILLLGYLSGFGYYLQTDINYYWLSTTPFSSPGNRHQTNVSVNLYKPERIHGNSTRNNTFLGNESSQTSAGENVTYYLTSYNMVDGRLGNQLFRYASLLGMARAQGRKLIILPGSDLDRTFKLHHVTANNNTEAWNMIKEEKCNYFDTRLMHLPQMDLRIKGYLQSFKYFQDVADEVRKEFIFQDYIASHASLIVHDVHAKRVGSLTVGVHVRRGDFLIPHNQKLGYTIPEKSYFNKAFKWIKSKFPGRNVTFLVASDDLSWCNNNLAGKDVIVMPPATPEVHLAALASCDHMIISSGSYGWWSGWLAGGYVIFYSGFMEHNTSIGKEFVSSDYYPPLWIGLGN